MCHEHLESSQNMDGTVKSTAPKIGRAKCLSFVKIIAVFVNYCTFPVLLEKPNKLDGTSRTTCNFNVSYFIYPVRVLYPVSRSS